MMLARVKRISLWRCLSLGLMALATDPGCATSKPKPSPKTPLPTSSRSCEPFRDPLEGVEPRDDSMAIREEPAYKKRHGCACAGDPKACGSFPCTPTGCYVSRCAVDSECATGMCSHYASWPHGYCVARDPK